MGEWQTKSLNSDFFNVINNTNWTDRSDRFRCDSRDWVTVALHSFFYVKPNTIELTELSIRDKNYMPCKKIDK